MMKAVFADVKLEFYKLDATYSLTNDINHVQTHITPLSRGAFVRQQIMNQFYLIGTIAMAALATITALFKTVKDRGHVDYSSLHWMLRQPIVAAVSIPVAAIGILMPEKVNKDWLGIDEEGFYIQSPIPEERRIIREAFNEFTALQRMVFVNSLKPSLAYEEGSTEKLEILISPI